MAHVADWLKSGLVLLGLTVAAIVALALFAVFAVAMRPLLIVGLVLAIAVIAVLAVVSPAFRDWFAAVGEQQTLHNGLRLATDVAVHPNHAWTRLRAKDAEIGADDLVQATLGPVESVVLPEVGSRVEQGQQLFSLRHGERTITVRSPLSGTVIGRNEALMGDPAALNEAPFTRGWAVRLRPDNVRVEGDRLFRGQQARGWFQREIDRLLTTVLADDPLAPALPDGGAVSDQLHRHIDDRAWTELQENFFGSAE
jgi:glycine cleavage system H protein